MARVDTSSCAASVRSSAIPCAVQVCDVKQLQDMVTTKLNALPNYKFKREGGGYRSYPHQFNATYFSACQESPRVRLHTSYDK